MNNQYNINSDYRRVYFNVESLDQSDVYLFAEKHDCEESKAINGHLISSLAKSHMVSIFVEGITSMKELKTSKVRLKALSSIDDSVQEDHLCFYGWDMDDDELYERKMPINTLINQLESMMEQSKQLQNSTIVLQNKIIQTYPDFPNNLSLEMFFSLSKEAAQDLKVNVIRLAELTTINKSLEQEITKMEEQINVASTNLLKNTHPRRVEAMVNTLQKIRKMKAEGLVTGKCVFVSGMAHLLTLKKDKGEIAFDLTRLYDELQYHHAAILIPKVIDE